MNGHPAMSKKLSLGSLVRIRCHGAAAAHGELTGAEHVVIRLCIIDGWLVVSSWGWLINVNKKILPKIDIRWASRIGFNIWSVRVYWCAAMVYWCAALVPRKWWCQPWTRSLKYDWRIFDVTPVRPKSLVNHPQESLGESATWVSFLESRTFWSFTRAAKSKQHWLLMLDFWTFSATFQDIIISGCQRRQWSSRWATMAAGRADWLFCSSSEEKNILFVYIYK